MSCQVKLGYDLLGGVRLEHSADLEQVESRPRSERAGDHGVVVDDEDSGTPGPGVRSFFVRSHPGALVGGG